MGNINVSMKPLNKGMITNVPTNLVPSGAFLDLEGFIVRDGKLRLRPRFTAANIYSAYDTSTYGAALDLIQCPLNSNTITNFVLTEKAVLKDTGTAYVPETVTRAAGATPTPFTYNSFTGIQTTIGRDSYGTAVWVTDGTNPIVKYGGATTPVWAEADFLDDVGGSSRTDMTEPRSVLYHDNRLWVAGPTDEQGTMLRWSILNNPDLFPDVNYMYFPNRTRPISRLMTLGQFLIIYFPDAIYIGQPSGDPSLPYVFDAVNTAALGLLGTRAISEWQNGHIFFSKHGLHWLGSQGQLQDVPCPIWSEFRDEITRTDKYIIKTAGDQDDLYISIPDGNTAVGKIFYYNTLDQAWSYWETSGDCLALSTPIATLAWNNGSDEFELPDGTVIDSWDGTVGTGFADAGIQTWADMARFTNPLTVALFRGGKLYALSEVHATDAWTATGTSFTLETGDFDFNEPDMVKTFHRFRMRTSCADDDGHAVTISRSLDGGRTWTVVDNFTVRNEDEGWRHFRVTGAEPRFRLTGYANTLPYDVVDMTFRVRGRGLETT